MRTFMTPFVTDAGTYPRLKIAKDDGLVVIFSAAREGTVVHSGDNKTYFPGDFVKGWSEDMFRYFVGTVSLSN